MTVFHAKNAKEATTQRTEYFCSTNTSMHWIMFELSDETLIMTSEDGLVKLTTHRVIYRKGKGKMQLMLEDFENYEFRAAHLGNYIPLTIFFFITTITLLIQGRIQTLNDNPYGTAFFLIWPSLVLFTISFLFILISRRYFIRINGKFNHIEFRIRNPDNKSVKKFIEALVYQSNYRKSAG